MADKELTEKYYQRHAASLAALRAVMATQKAKAKPEWMGWPVLKGGSK